MEIKKFLLTAYKQGDRYIVEDDFIKLVLRYNIQNFKKDHQNLVKKTKSGYFQSQVLSIWRYCTDKKARPWDNKENIIGCGLNNVFFFNSERLEEKRFEIETLLKQVSNAKRFEEMKLLNDGLPWTNFRAYVEMLVTLGNALNLICLEQYDEMGQKTEYNNPALKFTLSKKI